MNRLDETPKAFNFIYHLSIDSVTLDKKGKMFVYLKFTDTENVLLRVVYNIRDT